MRTILITLCLCVSVVCAQDKPPQYVAIKGGTIHRGDGAEVKGVILIKDGVIEAVGENVAIPAGAEVIDVPASHHVTPGFIDLQSHLGCVFEADETTEAMTPHLRASDAYSTDLDDVRAAYGSGVTTVALSPGERNVVGGAMSLVKLKPGYLHEVLVEPVAAMKVSLSKAALHSDRAPTSLGGAIDMLEKELADATSELGRRAVGEKRPVFVNVDTAEEVARALALRDRFGLRLVLVHAENVEGLAELLKDKNVPVVLGPLALTDSKKRLTRPAELAKAGVRVAFATDYPAAGVDGLRRTAILAARHGLPVGPAMAALTGTAADLLGAEKKIGLADAGRDGDFVVYDGHPLSPASAVQTVIVGGKVTFKAAK